ncbi:MAG TPA: collagen-like protein [Chitinophaga sp.]|nr:collagen-like protein [Chitinophaga sp.]
MKKLSGFFFFACLFSVMIGISSCGKDGDTGPAGPAGETGPKGDKGDKGDAGEPGTANVVYSAWLDTEFALDTTSGDYVWGVEVPQIDQELLNTGFVKVYINLYTPDQPNIGSVPYTDGTVYIRDVVVEGGILLISNYNVSTVEVSAGVKRYQVRYVIVPGGVAARTAKSIDWSNYAEVQAHLGLKN